LIEKLVQVDKLKKLRESMLLAFLFERSVMFAFKFLGAWGQ
jgi:hypothetical protein